MATDADIVPQALTDFVFDLYDSVTLSQLTEEQSRLYNNVFRDLSSKVCNVTRKEQTRTVFQSIQLRSFHSIVIGSNTISLFSILLPRLGLPLQLLLLNAMETLSFSHFIAN